MLYYSERVVSGPLGRSRQCYGVLSIGTRPSGSAASDDIIADTINTPSGIGDTNIYPSGCTSTGSNSEFARQ